MLRDANPAGADALDRRIEVLVLRQTFGIRPADQDTFHGNLVDRRRDQAARGLDLYFQVARQFFALAFILAVALTQQDRAARFELLRKLGDGGAGLGDALAMGFGFLGRAVDLGGAVADRDDEMRGGGGVFGDRAGGFVLFRHRAIDGVEHRADRLDRLRNAMHRIDRTGGILLQRVDLLADLFGGALGLHRERFHLGRDHREAAPGGASACRLDGGVECQQRGLPRDLRDQIDDVADRGRGFAQPIDIGAGFARGGAGLIGELAGVAYLGTDALRRMGEFFRGLRERGRGILRGAGAPGQRVGALADGCERRCGCLGATGDRIGCALELPDHRAEFKFEQFEDFPGGIAVRRRASLGRDRRRHRLRFHHGRSRFRQTLSKQTERHGLLSGTSNETRILASGREVVVNDCLLCGQWPLPAYQKCRQIFDFARSSAYNAALSIPINSGRIPDQFRTNPKERRMAGHSQFKNIMHRKGRQDAQKSKLFSKLAREITVAAKMGQPDPSMNARLRAAIISARQENMSKDSIERAVKKASGAEGENYDEIRYEGYGPGGVAVIVEALTDNRNRAASDIRSYFTKAGGNLGETGSVAFMFDRTGIIEYDAKVASDDAMLEAAIEAGADDVSSSENGHEIYASQDTFREVAKALEAKFGEPRKAALTWKPQNTVPVDDETGEKLLKLIDLLNEHDDVQNVYANFEVSDALLAKMGG